MTDYLLICSHSISFHNYFENDVNKDLNDFQKAYQQRESEFLFSQNVVLSWVLLFRLYPSLDFLVKGWLVIQINRVQFTARFNRHLGNTLLASLALACACSSCSLACSLASITPSAFMRACKSSMSFCCGALSIF